MKNNKKGSQTVKKNIIPIIILIVLVLAGILFFTIGKSVKLSTNFNTNSSSEIILYYGDTCSHCKLVEKYIQVNNIDSKIDITKKEIFNNNDNALEFNLALNSCNIKEEEQGVPAVIYQGKCYVGDTDVLAFLDKMSSKN
ncbi:MAG: hypothetical protein WC755_00595 [Candidatus Woesearchaeota archaeon]|jgi:glutaredoxin